MKQLKTLRLNLPMWWLSTVLSTVTSPLLERVLLAANLHTHYTRAHQPFEAAQADWVRCDDVLARVWQRTHEDPTIPRTPLVVMLAVLKPTPLITDPMACADVFDIFTNLRADGHFIGLRSYAGWDELEEEVWCDDRRPHTTFSMQGAVDRAGF